MPQYAKLRTDLVSSPAEVDGQTVYNIKDPITGRYFRLREPEWWLVRQLDGDTDYETVAQRFRDKFNLNITAENVMQFVQVLEQQFFLENNRAEMETSRAAARAGRDGSAFSRLLFIKVKGIHPGRFLDWLTRWYRPFHNPWIFAVHLLIILAGVWVYLDNMSQFWVGIWDIFTLGSVLAVVVALFILVTLHEFAHAVICRYYGGEVREIGFLLIYFQPAFYCDLSDAWLFSKKRHRLAVTLAGPYFQLVLTALALLVWRVTVPGTFVSDVARLMTIVSAVMLLVNFNPLIKLDGYYILSDWLDIPGLRARSFGYLKNLFQRHILGWPIEPVDATPRHKRVFTWYAFFAIIYSILLLTFIFWIVGSFLYRHFGAGGLLLLLVVVSFMLRSTVAELARGTVRHIRYMKQIIKRPTRLIIQLAIIALLVIVLFFIPIPHRVSGEITVQPIAEFSLLLNEFGLLERNLERRGADAETRSSYLQMASTDMAALDLVPFARDGQTVSAGDTLAILVSNQVTQDIIAEQSLLERLRRQLALLKSPPKPEAVREAEAAVVKARASYEQLKRDLERIQRLADQQLTATDQLETAEAAVDIALAELNNRQAALDLLKSPPKEEEVAVLQAEIDKQQAEIDFLRQQEAAQVITTPITGQVATVGVGEKIMEIRNNQRVEITVPVTDFDIDLVQVQQEVKAKVRPYPSRVFIGSVVHVPQGATVDQEENYFPVSTVFDNNDGSLVNGMTGYAKIEVGQRSIFSLLLRKAASVVRVEFWSWW